MKKLMAMFAIAILVMSFIPVAFASGNENQVSVTATNQVESEGDHELNERLEVESGSDDDGTEVENETEVEDETEVESGDDSNPAPIAPILPVRKPVEKREMKDVGDLRDGRARLEVREERLQEAKLNYVRARERFELQKEKVAEVREKFKECKADNSTECQEAKEKVKENAKPFLGNSLEMILKALERLKEHVTDNENMNADAKTRLLAKIDAKIAVITAAQAEIEALGENATPEQIREAAKTARDAWKETKPVVEESSAEVVNAKLGNIIHQTEQLSTKIHSVRDRLANQSKDVTELDEKIVEFDAKLALAKTEYQGAQDALAAGGEDAVQAAHEHVKKAQEYLKEVRESLRDIVKELRANGAEVLVNETNAAATA